MKHLVCFILAMSCQVLMAQSPALLDSIVAHNTALQALEEQAEADIILNHSELRWEDPDASVGYRFSSPKGISSQTNLGLKQSLDWDLVTGQKKKMVRATDAVTRNAFLTKRQQIIAEIRRQLTWLVYYNRLSNELYERVERAREIQKLYRGRYEQGDINLVEWNKVRLNTCITQNALERANTGLQAVLMDLQRLNGDRPVSCADTVYSLPELPELVTFQNQVLETHPLLAGAKAGVQQAESSVKVARAQAVPSLDVGYSGSFSRGINSNSLTFGVSLPLWGRDRKKIKENKARLTARRLEQKDAEIQLRASVARQYTTVMNLQNSVRDMEDNLRGTDNGYLLRRSLEEGHISLLDYLLELSFYYTARTAYLEAERDAKLAQADLWSMLQ